MKTFLKWVLWILIGLLIAAAIFAVGYFAFNHWNGGWMMGGRADEFREGGRIMPWRNMPMHPFGMTRGMRVYGFSPFMLILGGLFRLAVPVLIIVGIVALVLNLRRKPATAAPTVVQAVPAQQPVPSPVEPAKTCSNCGRAVQADWTHCPYCGSDLA